MSRPNEYRPEDMEALLISKRFSELYEEEKIFVLKHLSSAEEYEEMRRTLLNIQQLAGLSDEDDPSPRPQLKNDLLNAFRQEQKRKRSLWLNGIALWFRGITDVRRPAFRYALGILLIAAAVGIWWSQKEEPQIAGEPVKKDTIAPRAPELPVVKKDTLQPAPPPAPVPAPAPVPQLVEQRKDSVPAQQKFFVDAEQPRALEEDAELIGLFYTAQ